jgi:FtsH-binding integral membrane protein
MSSAEQAAVGVAAATVIGLGIWLYGRWQRGHLKWTTDGLAAIGVLAWGFVIAGIFLNRSAATYLVPPAVLLGGGVWLYTRAGSGRSQRVAGIVGAFLGLVGVVSGALQLLAA